MENTLSSWPRGNDLRIARLLSLLILLMGSAFASTATAQAKQDSAQALRSAADISDVRGQNSPSFELDGTIQMLGADGNTSRGTYRLIWISRHKWRDEIVFSDYSRIRVGADEKYWMERSLDYELPQIGELDEALDFVQRLTSAAAQPSRRAKSEKIQGLNLMCARSKLYPDHDFCVEPSQGSLVLERLTYGDRESGGGKRLFEYSDFIRYGEKLFPGSVTVTGSRAPVVTLSVQHLGPPSEVGPDTFNPGAHDQEMLACLDRNTKGAREKMPEYPLSAKQAGIQGGVVIYAVIGSNGAVSKPRAVESTNPELSQAALRAVSQWTYAPPTCGGVTGTKETFISVTFRLNN